MKSVVIRQMKLLHQSDQHKQNIRMQLNTDPAANTIRLAATGAYLDEALHRLERANGIIDDIKAQVSLDVVYSMIKEWEEQ